MLCQTSITRFVSATVLLSVLQPSWGTVIGKTYSIAEPDIVQETMQRAAALDWQAIKKRINVRAKVREGSHILPRAEQDAEYLVDLTYTLPFDIPDGKGGILYPKGYRFDPVKYVQLPFRIGVIGKSNAELEWAKQQGGNIFWMTSGGDPYLMTKELKAPVFLYTERVHERLRLRATPVLITQKKGRLVARQYAVADEGEGNR